MRLLGIVSVVLLVSCAARPQQVSPSDVPASKEDIQRVFAALHIRERQKLIVDTSRQQAKSMATDVLQKEFPEASKEEFSEMQGMINAMVDDIEKDYPLDAILQDMIPVYQRHLTKSDSEELITFYSSTTGQKLLRELPAVTSESMQISNSYLQPRMEAAIKNLRKKIDHMVEEDRKKKAATSSETKPAQK
jgi:hypothetical protein